MVPDLTYGPIVAIRRWPALLLSLILLGVATPALAEPLRVVALGDSLTAGLGVGAADAFPSKLQAELSRRGIDASITNAGVSGDTAAAGLSRLDWSVPDGTQAVLIELGANDMLKGEDPAGTEAALDEMVARLKVRGIAVMLLGMRAAPNLGASYQKAFDGIFPALAAKHNVPLYGFFLDGVAGEQTLNQPDGMHPNPKGVDVIVSRAAPAIGAFLATVGR